MVNKYVRHITVTKFTIASYVSSFKIFSHLSFLSSVFFKNLVEYLILATDVQHRFSWNYYPLNMIKYWPKYHIYFMVADQDIRNFALTGNWTCVLFCPVSSLFYPLYIPPLRLSSLPFACLICIRASSNHYLKTRQLIYDTDPCDINKYLTNLNEKNTLTLPNIC